MGDWFFQECLASGQETLLIDAIQSGQIGIEDRDCIDRTPLMVALKQRGLVQISRRNDAERQRLL